MTLYTLWDLPRLLLPVTYICTKLLLVVYPFLIIFNGRRLETIYFFRETFVCIIVFEDCTLFPKEEMYKLLSDTYKKSRFSIVLLCV